MLDLDELEQQINAAALQLLPVEVVSEEQLAAMMDKARKLLSMAEQGATQAERDAFAGKAAAMMARYGITAAMLSDAGVVTRDQVVDWLVEVGGPYTYDKVDLLAHMVAAYSGRCVYVVKGPQHSEVRVYAMGPDIARMQVLWPSLLRQMNTELGWAAASKPYGTRLDVFSRSFIQAYAVTVRTRLTAAESSTARSMQQERDDAGVGGKSVALVLASRKDEVERAYSKANPGARATRRRSLQRSSAGAAAGQQAGQRADLGYGRITGSD